MTDSNSHNHLIDEKSPYLRQHAWNPVEWYPWSDKALNKARKEDKPVFLSIGYSSCHWCHVMEKESFSDMQVAELMNKSFINIKVDREERPDLDSIYMEICQIMTGTGGWPLNVIMTPEKIPFWAGTYIPRMRKYGRPGMLDLIPEVKRYWLNNRDKIAAFTSELMDLLSRKESGPENLPVSEIVQKAYRALVDSYDNEFGGFGGKPKFPAVHNLLFLLDHWRFSGERRALTMVETTLSAMKNGGIYDQLGGGFHRYSTDRFWRLPHFEKMLYDQAMLILIFLETYRETGKKAFGITVEETLEYVFSRLDNSEGAYFASEDADSEGREGEFYVWGYDEIRKLLSEQEFEIARKYFSLNPQGNFMIETSGKASGKNILYLNSNSAEITELTETGKGKSRRILSDVKNRLSEERSKRKRPEVDDKILTDWNSMIMASLARAGKVLQQDSYIDRARQVADFILSGSSDHNRILYHLPREDGRIIRASLDDYAFFVMGLLELYAATYDHEYLLNALDFQDKQIELFYDHDRGAFYFSEEADPDLIIRQKIFHDSAYPSGNAIALHNLIRTARLTGDEKLITLLEKTVKTKSVAVSDHPTAYIHYISALERHYKPSVEVRVYCRKGEDRPADILAYLDGLNYPNLNVLLIEEEYLDTLKERVAGLETIHAEKGRPSVYICFRQTCYPPSHELSVVKEFFQKNNLEGNFRQIP